MDNNYEVIHNERDIRHYEYLVVYKWDQWHQLKIKLYKICIGDYGIAMTRKFRYKKFGLAEDPIGYQVTFKYKGQILLGDVVDYYRNEVTGITHLRINHFDGDPWTIEPGVLDVNVLIQTLE